MILGIMYAKTFKTDAIVFICIKRHNVISHLLIFSNIRASTLILTISLSKIKEKMSNLVLIKTNYKKPAEILKHYTLSQKMNDNINMGSTITGSVNDNMNIDSTITGSVNDNINRVGE